MPLLCETCMTDHPAKGCTPAQITAFEQIAIGQTRGHSRRTLDALKARNLIDYLPETLPGHFPVTISVPFVPLPVHHQWCTWASEQPDVVAD